MTEHAAYLESRQSPVKLFSLSWQLNNGNCCLDRQQMHLACEFLYQLKSQFTLAIFFKSVNPWP